MPKKKADETVETQENKECKEPGAQEVQPETQSELEQKTQPDPEAETEPEQKTQPDPEAETEPEQKTQPDPEAETEPEQEKVQFRVQIKDKKVALRTSPEFRIDNSNLFDIADQEGTRLFDILEVKNGYGRVAYPAGTWISLDACIKY